MYPDKFSEVIIIKIIKKFSKKLLSIPKLLPNKKILLNKLKNNILTLIHLIHQ